MTSQMKIEEFYSFLQDLQDDEINKSGDNVTDDVIYVIQEYSDSEDLIERIEKECAMGEFDFDLVVQMYAEEVLGFFVGTAWEFVEENFDSDTVNEICKEIEELDDYFGRCFDDFGTYYVSPDEQEEIKKALLEQIKLSDEAYHEASKNIEETFEYVKMVLNKADEDLNLDLYISVDTRNMNSCYFEILAEEMNIKIRISDHKKTSGLHEKPDMNLPIDLFHSKPIKLADFEYQYHWGEPCGELLEYISDMLDIDNIEKYQRQVENE